MNPFNKLKVGDKVKCIDRNSIFFHKKGIVLSFLGIPEYDYYQFGSAEEGFLVKIGEHEVWEYYKHWEKI